MQFFISSRLDLSVAVIRTRKNLLSEGCSLGYSEFVPLVNEVDALRILSFSIQIKLYKVLYCYTNFDFVLRLIYFFMKLHSRVT